MMSQASQTALAAANGRYPANTRAGARVSDPTLKAFGLAGRGGVADAEHPADVDRLVRPRVGVGQVDEGLRRHQGAGVLRDRGPQHRKQDRLARSGGAPPGAPPAFRPRGDDLSPRIRPAGTRHRLGVVAALARRRRPLRHGRLRDQDRAARDRQRDRALGGVRPRHGRALDRAPGPRRGHARDRRGLPLLARDPAEVPHPRHGLPPRLPDRADRLQRQRRLHELVDRPHPAEGRGDRGHRAQLAQRGARRRHLRDGAGARRERRPRPAPRRRRERARVRRHGGGARAESRSRAHPRRGDRRGARGLHARPAEPAARARPGARRPSRSRSPATGRPRRGLRDGADGRADAALRRRSATSSSASPTARSSATTARLVRRRERRGARAGLADAHRPRELLRARQRPPRPRPVLPRLRLDVRLRHADRVPVVRARALPRDRAEPAGDAVPAHVPVAARDPLRDSGLPLAARVAGAPQRRLRRRQQRPAPERPLAVRPDLGEGLVHPRQRLAHVAVLLPRLPRRAAVDPRRARRGGAGRRRRPDGGLPPDHAAAAARRGRAAPDRVVRLQLQQLQQHLPADRRRPAGGGPVRRRRDRHPDQLHVQARLRGRQGPGLRARERRLDRDLLHRRRRSRGSPSGARSPWRTSHEHGRRRRDRASRSSRPARACAAAARRVRCWPAPGGGT